jgi:hypothetical protein
MPTKSDCAQAYRRQRAKRKAGLSDEQIEFALAANPAGYPVALYDLKFQQELWDSGQRHLWLNGDLGRLMGQSDFGFADFAAVAKMQNGEKFLAADLFVQWFIFMDCRRQLSRYQRQFNRYGRIAQIDLIRDQL